MEAVQSERISRPTRIICIALISLMFLIAITSLFLLVFVIEGQSFLRRVAFFLLGLGILGYYVQFLKIVMSRRKRERRNCDATRQGKNKSLLP